MTQSYAFVAKHLAKINKAFDTGIVYHYTDPAKVSEIKDLVSRAAVPLDYGLPTVGTAYPRLNVIVKQFPNKESWQYSGGAFTTASLDEMIERAKEVALHNNPNTKLKSDSLQVHILNEWERYAVVFELQLNLEAA